jgi:hypothetical protein
LGRKAFFRGREAFFLLAVRAVTREEEVSMTRERKSYGVEFFDRDVPVT